jgi:hypothetical protein
MQMFYNLVVYVSELRFIVQTSTERTLFKQMTKLVSHDKISPSGS